MKKLILISTIILLALPAHSFRRSRMMLVGDSWASLMCLNRSFESAFSMYGLETIVVGCLFTSKIGMHASSWLDQKVSQRTDKILKKYNIDVVYLSIGGNDFLANWNKSMSGGEEDQLFLKIKNDTKKIIDHLLLIHPHVKILLSGYDFGNFVDNHPIKSYRKIFEKMGKPAPYEIHSAILRFSSFMNDLRNDKNIFYIHHYGLMHFYNGNPDEGLPAEITLPPQDISPPNDPNRFGGDPSRHQYYRSMFSFGRKWNDAYHLSQFGFLNVALHSTEMYLSDWFNEDTY